MEHEILYRPSHSLLRLLLQPGEQLLAESGAMVSMTPNIKMQTQARGGILGGLKRAVLGGESFFINTFTCEGSVGEATFAAALPGDMMHIPMAGGVMMLQSGAFICSSPTVNMDTSWGGAKGFFSGTGAFLLRCEGQGDLFIGSYGAVHPVELQAGQSYIVDTGHIVAFEGTMDYKVQGAGGLKQTLFSGEGLVCNFTGPGRLYLQSRNFQSLIQSIIPHLPKSSS